MENDADKFSQVAFRHPFSVGRLTSVANLKDAVANSMDLENLGDDAVLSEYLNSASSADGVVDGIIPSHLGGANITDTSCGGNEAINPLWQFCADDDIVHPSLCLKGSKSTDSLPRGMGRVYNETYNNHQKILWMSFGLKAYSNLKDFYTGAIDSDMSALMNRGSMASLGRMLVKGGIFFGFTVPFYPLIQAGKLITSAADVPISKYYDFKPAMPLYYRMVNTMIGHLAAGMGLLPGDDTNDNALLSAAGTALTDDDGKRSNNVNGALPSVLQNGPDIFKIINKRASRIEGANTLDQVKSTDDISELAINGGSTDESKSTADREVDTDSFFDTVGGWLNDAWAAGKHSALGGTDYVGFRIERGTDVTESVSNNTGESSIASKLNGAASSGLDSQNSAMGGSTGVGLFDGIVAGLKDASKAALSAVGGSGLEIKTGSGFFSIPEIWKGSSFSRSFSFSMKLRAKYADPVSIYQGIYIPLCMILSGALPRSIGTNAYTSPFYINCYAKGLFAIPLGIIDSVSVKRGVGEFGWAENDLPTAVDVEFTIKDLSPSMFLGLMDSSPGFLDIFSKNSEMITYLDTLSGVGQADSGFLGKRMKANFRRAVQNWNSTYTNPNYWGTTIGSKMKIISNVLPGWRLPN